MKKQTKNEKFVITNNKKSLEITKKKNSNVLRTENKEKNQLTRTYDLKKNLCPKCADFVLHLLQELQTEAKKMKRGTLILDAIDDLQVCIEDGNISSVVKRDLEYQQGNRIGRKVLRDKNAR